ncbi:MAG TPA: RHS repeat-associated core domain-containing protein [Candidatus Angelobacter sp.]
MGVKLRSDPAAPLLISRPYLPDSCRRSAPKVQAKAANFSGGTGANLPVFSIGYDFHLGNGDNGNVYDITNNRDSNRSQSFTYDALNRLISAQNAGTDCTQHTVNGLTEYWGNSYDYDAWGNLLQKNVTKCSAENLSVAALVNNQLVGYSYDSTGNMTHDATTGNNYSYDQENRINGTAGYTYTYDADGNRVEKSNGSTGTLYFYMSPGIVAESDLSGTLKSEYVFFDGGRAARRDLASGAVSYYFSDRLKTAAVITDSAGTIKEDEDFYPWGGELPFVNNDPNKYKFSDKERDAETGLDYFGARFYGNALGRFTSPDPKMISKQRMLDPQQWNMYSYTANNPLKYVDPDGKELKIVVFLEPGNKGNADYTKRGAIRAANQIHQAGVKNVTIEFRNGTPDKKTLAGLNSDDHAMAVRVQNPSEKSFTAKASEFFGGGKVMGEAESLANVVHVYPDGNGFERYETHQTTNIMDHEMLHRVGEDHLNDQPGNVMDNKSYDADMNDTDLRFDPHQEQSLQVSFNRDGEVDKNPNGATCVGGCPEDKNKEKPK